ncbi:unnamed protein product [Urochloa humidicola]
MTAVGCPLGPRVRPAATRAFRLRPPPVAPSSARPSSFRSTTPSHSLTPALLPSHRSLAAFALPRIRPAAAVDAFGDTRTAAHGPGTAGATSLGCGLRHSPVSSSMPRRPLRRPMRQPFGMGECLLGCAGAPFAPVGFRSPRSASFPGSENKCPGR